jgi:DNA-binding NarL/FixJ family response regulator
MHSSEDHVLPAFANGASGYVLKDSCVEDLVHAIHQSFLGHRYLSPQLAERAIDTYLHTGRNASSDLYETLSQREREVLQLSAEGYSYGEIAERLFISPRTVETHRNNVMRKLGLSTVSDLVRFAIKRGLISVDA